MVVVEQLNPNKMMQDDAKEQLNPNMMQCKDAMVVVEQLNPNKMMQCNGSSGTAES